MPCTIIHLGSSRNSFPRIRFLLGHAIAAVTMAAAGLGWDPNVPDCSEVDERFLIAVYEVGSKGR